MNKPRLNRILDNMKERNLSQMIICDPATIYYLTGAWLHTGERMLVLYITADKTPILFINKLFPVPEDFDIPVVFFGDTDDCIAKLVEYTDHSQTMGVDKLWEAKFLLHFLELGGATNCVDASICADRVRQIKDEEEQKLMLEASRINDECMDEFKDLLCEGITELEMSNHIYRIFKEHGADDVSFTPIVGFGANAAYGHHEPDDTKLKKGDCVVLDVGCIKDGYCSDMTRTFFFDYVTDENAKIYDLVLKANQSAEDMIKEGVRFCDIDKTARDIIESAGYGENFNHRLGHSIGFECHEAGDVSSVNTETTAEGMIFSIEPGIYIKEKTGVRIEDLVMTTKDGCVCLNKFPKTLTVIKSK